MSVNNKQVNPIFLADDTITMSELHELSKWMLEGNRLTKADQTVAFENEFKE